MPLGIIQCDWGSYTNMGTGKSQNTHKLLGIMGKYGHCKDSNQASWVNVNMYKVYAEAYIVITL